MSTQPLPSPDQSPHAAGTRVAIGLPFMNTHPLHALSFSKLPSPSLFLTMLPAGQ